MIPDEASKFLDAARKAQAPDGCTLGRITMFVPEGNDLFNTAVGRARRDAVLQFLNANGIDPSRFFADVLIFGGENTGNDAQLEYTPRDQEPPKLNVTSTPEKGKKVRANQRITVKAIALDDANPWQTGIKSIDLIAEGGGPFGFQDYPLTCDRPSPPRTLEGVYTVPANPPPLVRLRATATDFAGNKTDLWAEFPTGDWYGWIEWSETLLNVPSRTPTRFWGRLDFTADYDGSGNLTGRMAGIEDFEGSEIEGTPCDSKTTKPTFMERLLLGQYTPGRNTISLSVPVDAKDLKFSFGELSYSCGSRSHQFGRLDAVLRPELNDVMRNITLTNERDADVTREWNLASNGIGKLRMSLTLRRARN